jgi:hypothetical protein
VNGQPLTIELVEPVNDLPNAVVIRWPDKATVCTPRNYDQAAAAAMRILAAATGGAGRDQGKAEAVNGDDVSTRRGYWWIIVLYLACAILTGVTLGLTAVAVGWLLGWL